MLPPWPRSAPPQAPSNAGAAEGSAAQVSISADVLKALAEAEAARAEQAGSSASAKEIQSKLADSIDRIVEQVRICLKLLQPRHALATVVMLVPWPRRRRRRAIGFLRSPAVCGADHHSITLRSFAPPPQAKKLKEEEGKGDTAGEQAVRRELENIIEAVVQPANGVDPQDLKCAGCCRCCCCCCCCLFFVLRTRCHNWGQPWLWEGRWVGCPAAEGAARTSSAPAAAAAALFLVLLLLLLVMVVMLTPCAAYSLPQPGDRCVAHPVLWFRVSPLPPLQAHEGAGVWRHHLLGDGDAAAGHTNVGAGGGGQGQPVSALAAAACCCRLLLQLLLLQLLLLLLLPLLLLLLLSLLLLLLLPLLPLLLLLSLPLSLPLLLPRHLDHTAGCALPLTAVWLLARPCSQARQAGSCVQGSVREDCSHVW